MKHVDRPDEIWNAHSLYTTKLSAEFYEIKRFLLRHKTEFVIIDLNGGWYDMDSGLWTTLKTELDT